MIKSLQCLRFVAPASGTVQRASLAAPLSSSRSPSHLTFVSIGRTATGHVRSPRFDMVWQVNARRFRVIRPSRR
jgi:hypothetical protein